MADKFADRLAGYVEVKDRIAVLLEFFPSARITTTYDLTAEPDDKPKVICRALVYRDPDDPVPVTGTSWMYLPGTTSFTKGSEIENAETSAVGRAIGMMGILIDKSIATSNEIDAKAEPKGMTREQATELEAATEPVLDGPYTGTGRIVVRKTGPADGFLRTDPEGLPFFVVAFSEVDGKTLPQVAVRGPLAADMYDASNGALDGLVATIEGDIWRVPWKKDGKAMPPFQRLELARIKTSAWTLPTPTQTGPGLFDEDAERELDAALT